MSIITISIYWQYLKKPVNKNFLLVWCAMVNLLQVLNPLRNAVIVATFIKYIIFSTTQYISNWIRKQIRKSIKIGYQWLYPDKSSNRSKRTKRFSPKHRSRFSPRYRPNSRRFSQNLQNNNNANNTDSDSTIIMRSPLAQKRTLFQSPPKSATNQNQQFLSPNHATVLSYSGPIPVASITNESTLNQSDCYKNTATKRDDTTNNVNVNTDGKPTNDGSINNNNNFELKGLSNMICNYMDNIKQQLQTQFDQLQEPFELCIRNINSSPTKYKSYLQQLDDKMHSMCQVCDSTLAFIQTIAHAHNSSMDFQTTSNSDESMIDDTFSLLNDSEMEGSTWDTTYATTHISVTSENISDKIAQADENIQETVGILNEYMETLDSENIKQHENAISLINKAFDLKMDKLNMQYNNEYSHLVDQTSEAIAALKALSDKKLENRTNMLTASYTEKINQLQKQLNDAHNMNQAYQKFANYILKELLSLRKQAVGQLDKFESQNNIKQEKFKKFTNYVLSSLLDIRKAATQHIGKLKNELMSQKQNFIQQIEKQQEKITQMSQQMNKDTKQLDSQKMLLSEMQHKIDSQSSVLINQQANIEEKRTIIQQQQTSIAQIKQDLTNQIESKNKQNFEIQTMRETINSQATTIEQQSVHMAQTNNKIESQQQSLHEMTNKIENQQETIQVQKNSINHMERDFETQILKLRESLEKELKNRDAIIDSMKQQLSQQSNTQNAQYAQQQQPLQTSFTINESDIPSLSVINDPSTTSKIAELEEDLSEKNNEITALSMQLQVKQNELDSITKFKSALEDMNLEKIAKLEQKVSKLKRTKSHGNVLKKSPSKNRRSVTIASTHKIVGSPKASLKKTKIVSPKQALGRRKSFSVAQHRQPTTEKMQQEQNYSKTMRRRKSVYAKLHSPKKFFTENKELQTLNEKLSLLDVELKSVKNENSMLQEKLKLTNDIAQNYDDEIQVMLQKNQEKLATISPKSQKSYGMTQI